ncbi:beta-lactamase/transpeptidase-like protein [Ophiobolus disseminans]|uniref:Beta-lactamase/transpeptidase-like protein n=1 Tax=Ophiobolus disseminans TaxID=1469910 RepID=A0A6A7AIG0_9PLEO|nr:beta-lactamase/transpeptidase-like protein [Ophiobolus disseminans]
MSHSPNFEDTIKRAVTPGSERLLAGVALAAAGRSRNDGVENPPDYTAAYGTLQLDPSSPPVSVKTVMWLASCNKLVTTIAALQCIERGQFTLDDPTDVERLLPEWKDPEILTGFTEDGKPILQPAKEKMTLQQLLTHTSGVAYDFFHPLLIAWRQGRGEGPLTMRTPIVEGFTHPLIAEPGAAWMYGAGLDLVGLMVARANTTTLEAYMRENIFDVLGMDDTSFRPKERNNMVDRLMPITTRLPSGELVDRVEPDAPLVVPVEPTDDFGGGGLFGTAEDFLEVLKSILHGDGKLLKSESIDLMFTPALSEAQQATLDGLLSILMAAAIMIPGEPVLGTPGAGEWTHGIGGLIGLHKEEGSFEPGWLKWGGAPNLKWWIDRKGGTCGIFATQLYPAGELKHAFLGKMFEREMVAHFSKK